MMKAGMVMSLNNHQWADAATFIKHGPGFATAAGNYAAEDKRAAKIIDMLTAPDSPALLFAMVAIPMVAQLARNHQTEIVKKAETRRERRQMRRAAKRNGESRPTVETPPITVHVFKREIKLPIRFRLKLPSVKNVFTAFMAPTQFPQQITAEVFRDKKVVTQLHKMGLFPQPDSDGEYEDDDAA